MKFMQQKNPSCWQVFVKSSYSDYRQNYCDSAFDQIDQIWPLNLLVVLCLLSFIGRLPINRSFLDNYYNLCNFCTKWSLASVLDNKPCMQPGKSPWRSGSSNICLGRVWFGHRYASTTTQTQSQVGEKYGKCWCTSSKYLHRCHCVLSSRVLVLAVESRQGKCHYFVSLCRDKKAKPTCITAAE